MRKTAVDLTQAVIDLQRIAESADELWTSALIEDPTGKQYELMVSINRDRLTAYPLRAGARWPEPSTPGVPNEKRPFLNRSYPGPGSGDTSPPSQNEYTFGEAMSLLAQGLPGAKLLIHTVKAKCKNGSLKGPELKKAAIAAWSEATGMGAPTVETIKRARSEAKAHVADKRKTLEEQLRSGKAGISQWNSQSDTEKSASDLRKLNLAGVDLTDVDFSSVELTGSDFSGANLDRAKLWGARVKDCNFDNCTASNGNFSQIVASGSTFRNASFKDCAFRSATLMEAICTNARFENVSLQRSNLEGADFSAATFVNCAFDQACFDETTKFPGGFELSETLQWLGEGTDPRKIKAFNESYVHEELTFASFMERLGQNIDSERMKKAISMLKKESFELFSEVTDESVTGIVKSQRDPDLFYSCRLTKDGHYFCCTQNLNVCGGLRGAICKHLLVLVLGLAKANQLDPSKANFWARASTLHQAKLDKDIASQTFLKYKGVEAGEIDWRPTETVPEDFYAF